MCVCARCVLGSVLLRALCVCMCVYVCVFVSVITREMLSTAPLDASLALLKQQGAHVQHNGGIKRLLADCPARWRFSFQSRLSASQLGYK